jgi:hypothetical protein
MHYSRRLFFKGAICTYSCFIPISSGIDQRDIEVKAVIIDMLSCLFVIKRIDDNIELTEELEAKSFFLQELKPFFVEVFLPIFFQRMPALESEGFT